MQQGKDSTKQVTVVNQPDNGKSFLLLYIYFNDRLTLFDFPSDGSHLHGDQHATANVVPKGGAGDKTIGAHIPTRDKAEKDAMGKPRIEKDPNRPTEVYDKSTPKPNSGKYEAGNPATRKMSGKWDEQHPGTFNRRSAYAYADAYAAPAPVFRRSLEARDHQAQVLMAREAYMNALYARDMAHSYY